MNYIENGEDIVSFEMIGRISSVEEDGECITTVYDKDNNLICDILETIDGDESRSDICLVGDGWKKNFRDYLYNHN